MSGGKEVLLDGWTKAIRNNPVFAAVLLLGTLVTAATPVVGVIRSVLATLSDPAGRPSASRLAEDRDTILVPVRNALHENEALYEKLSSPLYNEPGWGVQESYYVRVRRDGPEKHELMRGLIDTMVQTNERIMSKLDGYVGRALSKDFKAQEALFRRHARLYQARWVGMQRAAVSGEQPPVAEPTFPPEFTSSLEAEIREVDRLASTARRP